MRSAALRFSFITLTLTIVACNEGVTPPRSSGIGMLEIAPRTPTLLPGDTQTFRALAHHVSGAVVPNANVTWSSSAPDTISISPTTGHAMVLAKGGAWLRAETEDGVSDSVRVNACSSNRVATGSSFQLAVMPGSFHTFDGLPSATFLGRSVLFSGAIMFGTNAEDLVVPVDIYGRAPADLSELSCVYQIQMVNAHYTRANVAIAKTGVAPPIRAEQETFAPLPAIMNELVLVRYTLRNVGTVPINGLRFGLLLDWDVLIDPNAGNAGDNFGRLNYALDALETYQAGLQTAGIASVSSPITTYRSFRFGAQTPINSDANKFDLLSSGIVASEIGPDDVLQIVGFGPFTIAPGATHEIVVALTAGLTREEFAENVQIARTLADFFPRRVILPDI